MDLALLTIAGLSLLLAVAMGLVLFRMQREARARADARVALLRAMASWESSGDAAVQGSEDRGEAAEPVGALLFAAREEPAPWGRRAAIAGAIAAPIVLALLVLPGSAPPGASPQPPRFARLELLRLQHAAAPDGLTISGIVQNAAAGTPLSRVAVTAQAYGSDGALVANGRAGLDQVTLGPGEQTAFVVKVPVRGAVARYRIGFRGPDGAVIAHVDRRAELASAQDTRSSKSEPWVP
jgi:hypothetical protein